MLKYLSLSPLTCDKLLVDYIFIQFNPQNNAYYSKELKVVNLKWFYIALFRIKKYGLRIKLDSHYADQLSHLGSEHFKHFHGKPKSKRYLYAGFEKDVGNKLEEALKKFPNLKIEFQKFIDCWEIDFVISEVGKKNNKVLYIDAHGDSHYLINKIETLEPFSMAKNHYMRIHGYNYVMIPGKEWNSSIKLKYAESIIKNNFDIKT